MKKEIGLGLDSEERELWTPGSEVKKMTITGGYGLSPSPLGALLLHVSWMISFLTCEPLKAHQLIMRFLVSTLQAHF